jgi:hypothetical protein
VEVCSIGLASCLDGRSSRVRRTLAGNTLRVGIGVARAVEGWVSPRVGCARVFPVDGRGFLVTGLALGKLCRGVGRFAVFGTCPGFSGACGERGEVDNENGLLRFCCRSG